MATRVQIEAARKRLRGTWRSDKKRTMASWVFPKRLAAAKLRWFADIFGRNTWKFGPKTCTWTYDEQRHIAPYKVLWADERSAVVQFGSGANDNCHHLFFDGEHFFMVAGVNGNVEYFKHAV